MSFAMRRQSTYDAVQKAARKPRARWILHLQAQIWRGLMGIGMFLHKLAPPRPPPASFVHKIPTTVAPSKGTIALHFYVPNEWDNEHKTRGGRKWPVVVNFHGGGFTLGNATDDARWCNTVVREVEAIVVSVDYRLAPEYAFPTAVEDGVDAILYLVHKADELGVDVDRIAVSGFSAGANMCFTVPLRLQEELAQEFVFGEERRASVIARTRPALQKAVSHGRTLTRSNVEISIKVVAAWYPPVDYTRTREQRRGTATRLDQQLPQFFTDLFDESYLMPPTLDMSNPYLSPGVAPKHMLSGLPEEIIIFACEWDMLVDESEKFRDRLVDEVGKSVQYFVVPDAPHGFDKAPNPIRQPPNIQVHYLQACKEIKRLLA